MAKHPLQGRWYTNPWFVILLAAVVGVPSVLFGLTLVAFFFANPVTWFLVGAVWFAAGFRHYRHHLTIRDTPMSKINAAAIGLVEVSGRVLPNGAENAPISGKPCVHWRVTVELKKDNESATLSEHRSSPRCFEIEDHTGRVPIWPWASELIVTDSHKWEGGAASEMAHTLPAGPIRDALTRHSARDGHLVVREEKIETGQALYVIGVLSERRHVAKTQPFWERVQSRVRPKPRSNLGTDGPGALEAAKIFLLAIVMVVFGLASGNYLTLPDDANKTAEPPEIDPQQVLIWRGEQDRPFIIADTPEGIVMRTLTQWTKLALLGGAGTMVGTLILYFGGFFS